MWISPIGCLTHPNDIDRGGSDGDPYLPSLPNSTVAVQSGYGGKEDFCAQPPLSGRMSYDGTSGTARPTITIGELPPNSQVAVNWLNNSTRGYVVAAVASGSDGNAVGWSLRSFRPGEQRGYQLVLSTADAADTSLGTLSPCEPPK